MKLNRANSPPHQYFNDPELCLDKVFNQQCQFMIIISPEGRLLNANDLALTCLATQREDCVGKFIWEIPVWRNALTAKSSWQHWLIEAEVQRKTIIADNFFHHFESSLNKADLSITPSYESTSNKLTGFILQAINITKYQTIKREAQEISERLKFVLKHTSIGKWELNLTDNTSHRTLRHDQIFGYDELLSEWTYEMFLEHVLPEDRYNVDLKFQKAVEKTTDWNFECKIRRIDGEIRWILASGGHEFNSLGQAKIMSGIVQDITEIKQTEIDKLGHAAELQSLFKALPDIYFRMASDGTILDYQAQNQSNLYTSPENFISKRMQDILPQNIGALFQSKIDIMLSTGEMVVFQYELPVSDKVLHFDARLNRIPLNDQIICVIRDVTDEFKSKQSLALSEQHFRTIFEQASIGVAQVNTETDRFVRVNQRFCDMLGYSIAQMCNDKTFRDITHPDDLQATLNYYDAILHGYSGGKSIEKRYLHKDGHTVWAEVTISPLRKSGGQTHPVIVVIHDISERKKAEDKVQLAANVFTHAGEGIIITDDKATIIDVNETFTITTGYSREEAVGQNPNFLQSGRQSSQFYIDMWQELLTKGVWSGEVWNRRKNKEIYAEILNVSSVKDVNGRITNYVGLFTDITVMKKQQHTLEHIAHYDVLTNLPNRVLLADRLSQAILQSNRNKQSLAVVFLDLDGFKSVNDAHGHDLGDELLIGLSIRMKDALRKGDSLARIGGDEFVAVLAGLTKIEDCEPVLDRLLLAAADPITIGDVILNVSASIGVTLYPQDNVDGDLLMRHADQAMYVAKESGKNCYHIFDTIQDDAVKIHRESLQAIRKALDEHQFVLYYQPKVNMRTGMVVGVEALIRWQHPEQGLLSPIEFLPIIENNPMSIEMGEWVIDTALTQIEQWQKIGLNLPLGISVNIAAVQLQQPEFTSRLAKILKAHPKVKPHYLELEVLETSALDDVNNVSAIMNGCRALGVNFALDDFGTGYSSLTYFRRLPASLIKIDQSFVIDMLQDNDDLAIVEGVIALAKSFKRDVIAEGVETIEHGIVLLELGCELAQGYGIAKPMPSKDFPTWFKAWKPDVSWKNQL